MLFFTVIMSVVLSVFSTAVMSYMTMAVPIGPWIAPTLVLFSLPLFKMLFRSSYAYGQQLTLATAAGSIGGIVATGFSFSFPALYFLNPDLFAQWMSNPALFAARLSGLALAAGGLGLWAADFFEQKYIVEQQMPFPIGELSYKLIAAQNQFKKVRDLMIGFFGTMVFGLLQGGIFGMRALIPKGFTLIPALNVGPFAIVHVPVRFDILPMLWSIGFVTGHVIAIPLLVGVLTKIFVVDPLNAQLFAALSAEEFVMAFCSGMVVSGALLSILDLPKVIRSIMSKMRFSRGQTSAGGAFLAIAQTYFLNFRTLALLFLLVVALTYFKFSALAQVYLVGLTVVCAYEIGAIAGKMGLAPLGRFATFVLMPAMFLFGLDHVQIVVLSVFVEVAIGTTADALFGKKMGRLAQVDRKTLRRFQLFGLVISSLCIGMIFWLLIKQFGLGTEYLSVQKAQGRALLVNFKSFNVVVLCVGLVFGYFLKIIKVNPALVLGGLLMPFNISLGLILGGLSTYLVKNKEEWEPFWSGVYVSNAIWMLAKAVVKIL